MLKESNEKKMLSRIVIIKDSKITLRIRLLILNVLITFKNLSSLLSRSIIELIKDF
tara:strand:- start:3708 stop:3875 length:168 start_codon:yes stop_codon:yes gene_type:complete